jgi:hypothetical protein
MIDHIFFTKDGYHPQNHSSLKFLTAFNRIIPYLTVTYLIAGCTRMACVVRTEEVRELYLCRYHLYLAVSPAALAFAALLSCGMEGREGKEGREEVPYERNQLNDAQHNTTQLSVS